MPEETKGTDPVSPESSSPAGAPAVPGEGAGSGGAKASAEPSPTSAAPTVPPPSAPAAKAETPAAAKAAEPAKPAAAPATGDKPAAPAAAKAPEPAKPTAAAPVAPKPAEPAKPAAAAATGEKPAAPAAAKPAAPAAAKPAPKPEGPKPEPWESELVTALSSQYGSGIKEASTYVGQKYLVVDSSLVYEILLRMRHDELFDIVYILYSFHHNERVRIKTQIKDGEHVRTAVEIWETANWLEREVFDMFGIVFDGHPDLKRILMPDGWKGHPLRKDYPILQQDQEWVKINLGIESGQ